MAYSERAIKKPFLSSIGSSRDGQDDFGDDTRSGQPKNGRTNANVNRVQT